MSAKDNFAQAMKELLNGETEAGKDTEERKPAPNSFSSFSQPETRPPKAPAPERRESAFSNVPSEEKKESSFGGAPALSSVQEPLTKADEDKRETPVAAEAAKPPETDFKAPSAPAIAVAAASATAPAAPMAAAAPRPAMEVPIPPTPAPDVNADVTVISAGTVVVGNISTEGDMRCLGEVKGDISVAKKLELTGKVIGDVTAEDAVVTASSVKGNISARNFVLVDGATTVVGDVSGKNAQVNGKIKGNLTVEERGHFESRATLVGNLVSGTVIIDEGAMLKGDIAITNAQNENINVEEPDFDIEI